MKTQLKRILLAILAFLGWLFALPTSAAERGGDKGGGFNFLPALSVMLLFAVLTACGGGSGGGSSATPQTYNLVWGPTVIIEQGQNVANDDDWVARQSYIVDANGATISSLPTTGLRMFAYTSTVNMTAQNYVTVRSYTVNAQMAGVYRIATGATVRETVYMADFSNHDCSVMEMDTGGRGAQFDEHQRVRLFCFDQGERIGQRGTVLASIVLQKTHADLLRICARDRDGQQCPDLGFDGLDQLGLEDIHFLAFPDQIYRRDNGECQSAPFYAADNCQSENAVNVGNFAAFVSGLNGNGYRQFGVRHRFDGDDWNAAAMVSHAKGSEFLDTWWGRLRFEHSVFGDASAFAEYESGITSLRQNGFLFADIPISGGRVGFRLDDFTASFGRPMHYNGKGKNAAAMHWQATKQTEFSFRSHNDNAEVHWQWRRRF